MLIANEVLWEQNEKKPIPKALKQLKNSLTKELTSPVIDEKEVYGRIISLQDFLDVSRMIISSKESFHNLKINLHLE